MIDYKKYQTPKLEIMENQSDSDQEQEQEQN